MAKLLKMNKLKVLILAMLVMLASLAVNAQDDKSSEQKMSVRVLVPANDGVRDDAMTALNNRLNQAVTLNGLGSTDDANRYLIVASVSVLSTVTTASVPVQYMAEVELALYFVDNINKVILSQEMITKKGLDGSADQAVAKAIKQIQARDPKLKKLIQLGKERASLNDGVTEDDAKSSGDPDITWIYNK